MINVIGSRFYGLPPGTVEQAQRLAEEARERIVERVRTGQLWTQAYHEEITASHGAWHQSYNEDIVALAFEFACSVPDLRERVQAAMPH